MAENKLSYDRNFMHIWKKIFLLSTCSMVVRKLFGWLQALHYLCTIQSLYRLFVLDLVFTFTCLVLKLNCLHDANWSVLS